MKIDITTGDAITPREMEYQYPCMFQEESLRVLAYPIETILAEKYESVIKRNISTTRIKELWKVYLEDNLYVGDLEFSETVKIVKIIAEKISLDDNNLLQKSL